MFHERGNALDSRELKLRSRVAEYDLGGKLPSLVRLEEAFELVVRSSVIVGNEGEDESEEFGR